MNERSNIVLNFESECQLHYIHSFPVKITGELYSI